MGSNVVKAIKRELKEMRKQVENCTNTDYLSGYLSAVSTIEGVIAEAENKTKNTEVVYAVIDYLNNKCGTHYKHGTEKTQKHINARLNDGFSYDDFVEVINKKSDEWLGTSMERYLTPDTLFGTKFEKYLNQRIVDKENYSDKIKNRVSDVDKWV
jgi:uncharacterized phage protein (TIGR02220 family)